MAIRSGELGSIPQHKDTPKSGEPSILEGAIRQLPRNALIGVCLGLVWMIGSQVNQSRGEGHALEFFHEKNGTNESFGIKEEGYNTEMMGFFDDENAQDGDWTLKTWRGGNLKELFTAWTLTRYTE
jgi:hypothetical protein